MEIFKGSNKLSGMETVAIKNSRRKYRLSGSHKLKIDDEICTLNQLDGAEWKTWRKAINNVYTLKGTVSERSPK